MTLLSPPRAATGAATGAAAGARYRPVDPDAYAPAALLPRRDVVRAIAVQLAILAPLLVWHGPVALAAAGVLTALHARRLPWRRLHGGDAPFVVDRPGVFVAGAVPGEPGRVVHWESIEAIVLCEVTSRRSRHRRPVPGIALRLRHHPDLAAIRRPLDDRPVDVARLLAAVTRYAPPGVAVVPDGPPLGDAFTARDVAADLARRAAGSVGRAAGRRLGPVTGVRRVEPAPLLLVDARGVHLGPGRLVPWEDVGAVVVLDVEERGGWHRAVGVVPPGATRMRAHRVARDAELDRPRLEAAVRMHAPHVPVVDGTPLRRAGMADVAAAVARVRHERRVARGYEKGSPVPDVAAGGRQGAGVRA